MVHIHLADLNNSFLIVCVCVWWGAASQWHSQVSLHTKSLLWGSGARSFTLLWTHSGDARYNVCCIHSLPRSRAPAITHVWFLNRVTGWSTCTFAAGFKWVQLIVGYHWRGHLPSPITSFSSASSHSCLPRQLLRGCLQCALTTCISFKSPGCRIFLSLSEGVWDNSSINLDPCCRASRWIRAKKHTQVNRIPSERLSRCDAHCVEVWLRTETAGIVLQPPLFNPDPVLLHTIYHTEYDSFPR